MQLSNLGELKILLLAGFWSTIIRTELYTIKKHCLRIAIFCSLNLKINLVCSEMQGKAEFKNA